MRHEYTNDNTLGREELQIFSITAFALRYPRTQTPRFSSLKNWMQIETLK